MLMIVMVCLGFYMLSATISAAIGAIMHLSGGQIPLQADASCQEQCYDG
jgi:hypothetical protein